MRPRKSTQAGATRLGRTVLLVITILLVTASLVYATVYSNILLNNGSVDEWSVNGIPVFQTDPAEDVTNADEDIINAWVASSDTNGDSTADRLDFLMEMAAGPALSTPNRAAVAFIDCDGDYDQNGVQEYEDRIVAYRTDFYRSLTVAHGDQSSYKVVGSFVGTIYGEVVGSFVEWGVPLSELQDVDEGENNPSGYCQNQIGISFATASIANEIGTPIDETDSVDPYDAPLAVGLRQFQGTSSSTAAAFLALLGAAAVVTAGWWALHRRAQR